MLGRNIFNRGKSSRSTPDNSGVQPDTISGKKARKKRLAVHSSGVVVFNPPKFIKKVVLFFDNHRLLARATSIFLASIIIFSIFYGLFGELFKEFQYQLSPKADALLIKDNSSIFASKLNYNNKNGEYEYNTDYLPNNGEVAGQISGPKFVANFKENPREGISVTDPYSKSSITIKPKYPLHEPRQQDNRLIYPLMGKKGVKVITLGVTGFKEDLIIEEFKADSLEFEYELEMPDYLEARLEPNGSIGIYGPDNEVLLGNVSTGTDEDAKLLEKARQNSKKTTLVFTLPAPYIKETDKRTATFSANFELKGSKVVLVANNLRDMQYPISIDPSIYIETAAQLMRGNNETNTDFDIDNELIQKSQTTGARIDTWEGNLDQSEGTWGQSAAAAGGYIYRTGGATGVSKPQIVSEQTTLESTDDTSFQMDMPSERPAGDLYIALMCHDDAGDTVTAPGGWTEFADNGEFAGYYKIGTDAGGGNEAASYTWTISSSEAKAGTIVRVTGFSATDIVSGTEGTATGTGTPQFPATTPDENASLVIRAAGADNDPPSATGWVPSGHTKIASGTSGGGDCGFVAASLDTPPLSGVSTGTADLDDNSIDDTWGSASIAINSSGVPPKPQIQGFEETLQNSNSGTFTMNMPSTRPAGDLYVALMCYDGGQGDGSGGSTSGNTISTPSGWTKYANRDGHAAYWKIGTDEGGGNEDPTYAFTGDSENWAGVILRVTGFDSSDVVSGTAGVGHGDGEPIFPATTPDNDNTLVIRAAGADNDEPSSTGWVPSGHTKIASGGSTQNNNDCAYVAASMNTPPASGVSTGTVGLADGNLDDDYGASTIAINPEPSAGFTESVRSNVNWAKFNPDTHAIESPNPGTGACSGWCSESAYDMPSGRRGHSMVAYNGYLYVIGGVDASGSRVDTVYITKLGVNGEPSLWNPSDSDPDTWEYWYESENTLPVATSYSATVAYNNQIYLLGGQTNAATDGITTVYKSQLNPTGDVESWSTTGMQVLPAGAGRYMHTAQVYNNTLYTIGGFEGAQTSSANMRNAVYYSKLDSDGDMNAWTATTSFTTARSTFGGSFTTIWGAYVYIGGGCTAVNGSGYCTTVTGDMQIASINADGTLGPWGSLGNLDNSRIGYSLIGWQGGLYRLGGCTAVDSSGGHCASVLADVDFGVVNPAGEVSTVNISQPANTGTCSGGAPESCDLPAPGDDGNEIGHMLNITVVLNGYLYVIGGCAEYNCNDGGNSPTSDNISDNTAYVAIDSDGTLMRAPSCAAGFVANSSWCVDSTNTINGGQGVAAAGVTVFNNRIYIIGGLDSTASTTGELYYNSVSPTTGALSGAWSTQTLSSVGISEDIFYTYAYARANPSQAGTYDGNLYIFGGCGNGGSGAGCSGSDYETEVYKCWIEDTGEIENTAGSGTFDCTTTGQLQIDSTPSGGGTDGLGIHSGTVYANYIYLVGGFSQAESDKDDVLYARFDNNNNVVAVSGGVWIESPNKLSVGRRRGWAFGYNGHIYAVGGYDDGGTGIIPFIEWSKMNVSDGSIETFVTSSVQINQRWGLSMVVSNSYAYVIGGCDVGISPGGCSSFEPAVQTFQLYNNDSGAPANFTAQSDQTFAANTDRIGASSAILNGYIYVAGGCTNVACGNTQVVDNVQFASISDVDGSIGSWFTTTDSTMSGSADGRAWGTLEAVGNSLYYVGGQDDTGDEKLDVYYATPSVSTGNVSTWSGSSNDLPADRTHHSSAVWNNRIYVVGGLDNSAAVTSTVYVSPEIGSGNIGSAWSSTTAFNVARSGTAVTTYANNLYLFGGFDGSNYLSDVQFTQINSDGTVDSWTYSTSLPFGFRNSTALSANGYIYLVGGRTASTTCSPKTLITPISANTTIATGNNPTGIGEWYETNVRYSGDRYGAAVAYEQGKIYTMGGGCSSVLSSNRHYESTVLSQPQVAIYSRMIDTDTNVFPNSWLMNGLDNSIGARWQASYRSAADGITGGTSIIFDEDFEAGSNGAAFDSNPVGGVNVDYDGCYYNGGTTTTFDNSWTKGGSLSGRYYGPGAGSGTACHNSFVTPITARYERFYLRLSANPNVDFNLFHLTNLAANGRVAEIAVTSTGTLLARDRFNVPSGGTGTTALDTTALGNRIEVGYFNDTMTVRLFVGANVDGSVPDETLVIDLDDPSADDDIDRVTVGIITNITGPWTLWIDEHKASNDTWVGSANPTGVQWGQETVYGDVTLGDVAPYTAIDATGDPIDFARWYFFFVSIDASKTFGYPEDVNRGPTIWDLSLFFTADPNKRLRHGKTFTGGELQPLDTPCRQDVDADCPLPPN